MVTDRPAEKVVILLWIRNPELRRQLSEFLVAAGYACVDVTSPLPPDCGLLVAEVDLEQAAVLARSAPLDRPDLRLLLVCGEPAYVGRTLTADPRVAFIEKPFAWRELRQMILELLTPSGCRREAPPAAVA